MIAHSGRVRLGWLGLILVLLPGFAWGQGPNPDLINYWSFNGTLRDTAGSYEQNAGTSATDMARFGGGAVLYGPGRTEDTFAVRTRPNAETYATVLDPDPLVVNQDAKFSPSYTVSVWTKTQAWGRSGWNYFMMDGPRFSTILFQSNSNGTIYIPNGPYAVFPQATQRQWSQLTFVGDAANSQTRLYINGQLKATAAGYNGLGTTTTAGYLALGGTNRSNYNGDIFYQDLAMWNTAKTDAEVASLYANGYGFSPPPATPSVPTLSWAFTEAPWDWNAVSGSVGIFKDLSVGRDRGVEAVANNLRALDGIHETLLYRSPAFNLASGGNLTFNVRGGSGGGAPFPQADSGIPLRGDATASGVLGVGLRDVATGQYVLSDTGISDNLAWKSVIWSPQQLAPFVGTGRSFTLDLIDARSGGAGGWAAYGADWTVNVGGAGATIDWGAADTGFNGLAIFLGAASATHTVNLVNPLDLMTMASLGVYGTGNYLPLPTAPVVTAVSKPGGIGFLAAATAIAGLAPRLSRTAPRAAPRRPLRSGSAPHRSEPRSQTRSRRWKSEAGQARCKIWRES